MGYDFKSTTLPETNGEGKTLKIGHSKRKLMGFQLSISRGNLLVSGRVKQPNEDMFLPFVLATAGLERY